MVLFAKRIAFPSVAPRAARAPRGSSGSSMAPRSFDCFLGPSGRGTNGVRSVAPFASRPPGDPQQCCAQVPGGARSCSSVSVPDGPPHRSGPHQLSRPQRVLSYRTPPHQVAPHLERAVATRPSSVNDGSVRFSPAFGPLAARGPFRVSIVYPQSIASGRPCSKRPSSPLQFRQSPWWKRFCPCSTGPRRRCVSFSTAYPGAIGVDPVAVGFVSLALGRARCCSQQRALRSVVPGSHPPVSRTGAAGVGSVRGSSVFRVTVVCAAARSLCAASRTR